MITVSAFVIAIDDHIEVNGVNVRTLVERDLDDGL